MPTVPPGVLAVFLGLGSITCALGALVFEDGYRRKMVKTSVGCFGAVLIFYFFAWALGPHGLLKPFFTGIAFFALWSTYMVVPLLILGGLQESEYSVKQRIGHAALVFSALICGPVLLPLAFLGGP